MYKKLIALFATTDICETVVREVFETGRDFGIYHFLGGYKNQQTIEVIFLL